MTPEKLFLYIKSRLGREHRFAFISAFAIGLLCHGGRLTEHLLNWDSAFNLYDPQIKISLGRFFLTLGCGISSYYDIQWVEGLLSLFYISLMVMLLVSLFELKSTASVFLTAAITVTFPVVASTFTYMYTADGYFLAGLCSTAGVWILYRKKSCKWFLLSVILLLFSAGCYQAYIAYGLLLVTGRTLVSLLYPPESEPHERDSSKSEPHESNPLKSDPLKKAERSENFLIRAAAAFIIAMILYLVCGRLVLALTGTQLSDYNGISEVAALGVTDRIRVWITGSVIDTAYYFLGPISSISLFKILNILMLILLGILVIRRLFFQANDRDPGRAALVLLLMLFMPFGAFMIYLISPEVRYYMLMMAPLEMIYLLPVIFYDRSIRKGGEKPALLWAVIFIMGLTVFNFALIDNITYLHMRICNERSFYFVQRLAEEIEELPDFHNAKKLRVMGDFPDSDEISIMLPPAMAGIKNGYLFTDSRHISAILRDWYDIELTPVEEEVMPADICSDGSILTVEEKGMPTDACSDGPVWPAKGSVFQDNDTVYLRLP